MKRGWQRELLITPVVLLLFWVSYDLLFRMVSAFHPPRRLGGPDDDSRLLGIVVLAISNIWSWVCYWLPWKARLLIWPLLAFSTLCIPFTALFGAAGLAILGGFACWVAWGLYHRPPLRLLAGGSLAGGVAGLLAVLTGWEARSRGDRCWQLGAGRWPGLSVSWCEDSWPTQSLSNLVRGTVSGA